MFKFSCYALIAVTYGTHGLALIAALYALLALSELFACRFVRRALRVGRLKAFWAWFAGRG